MSNFWIDTINIISAICLGILSFIDNFTKRSYEKAPKSVRKVLDFVKKIWVKLTIFFLICSVGFYTNHEKYKNIESDKIEAAKAFKKELDGRDSTNQKRLNESLVKANAATASSTAETMAKYYLKYDSAQNNIVHLVKDSIKKDPRNLRPFIEVYDITKEIRQDSINITTSLLATQGIATDVEVHYCNVIRIDTSLQFIDGKKGQKMIGNVTSDPFNFEYGLIGDKNKVLATIYVCIYGHYRNADKTGDNKIYPLLIIKSFNLKENGYSSLTEKEFKWIYAFIIKHKIKLPKV